MKKARSNFPVAKARDDLRMSAVAFARRIQRKPAKSEHCLQRALVKWCRGQGDGVVKGRFFAVPNGGARDVVTGARLKAEGVRPGAPDLVFYGPGGKVLWLELKNGTQGRLSAAQVDLHRDFYHLGHTVVVGRDLVGCIKAVINFYQP